ncbi:MAG: arylsulfatase [Candidatus Accumulibacter sp.]|uniref:Arylsulfatase n=1 Tax=Candidatus Accumulibacter affinis TaxID=2954384 RepID=A0A935W3E1_9PROT|nr:arylsulfatase [Candidatus Accumulibacter affinis]
MILQRILLVITAAIGLALAGATPAFAQAPAKKPNIVIIWGDDIGQSDISACTRGLMGFHTPNIDRVANEGMIFTDYYGEQSCTAGRSAFITGQSVFRTGLSKVGMPGAKEGLSAKDPTIAELLKAQGYATGQFGKNHLGDRDEMLPTAHGFDEFYGNLYHLNAEEEPEHRDYPKDPAFRKRFGPRGVLHAFADGRITDTGPLTKRRMETIDDDVAARSAAFIEQQHKAGKPVFVWVNFTHMHFRTHVKPESLEQSGRWQSEYHDAMIDHDKNVGTVLKKLDELGIADNTIVMYGTDNGPHMNTWPDAAMTPFRNEKNSNWEGAYRVPAMVRWPGKIKAGSVSNEIMSHLDWMPTLLAAAGDADVKGKLLKGYQVGKMNYKVHLDGYNFLPYLTGQEAKGPRDSFFYFSDDGDLTALRYDNWKFVFMEQRQPGTLAVWFNPYTSLRAPKLFNLRMDPYERADITSNTYWDWMIDHAFVMGPAAGYVGNFLATFKEFPPRQKAGSFTIDKVMEQMLNTPSPAKMN